MFFISVFVSAYLHRRGRLLHLVFTPERAWRHGCSGQLQGPTVGIMPAGSHERKRKPPLARGRVIRTGTNPDNTVGRGRKAPIRFQAPRVLVTPSGQTT